MDSVDDVRTITAANPSDKVPYRPRHRGLPMLIFMATVKPLRSLPSGHGIELVFFHGYRIKGLKLQNLNWKDSTPVDFSKNYLP